MPKKPTLVMDRIRAKLLLIEGHWIWTGYCNEGGYGQVNEGNGRCRLVHLVVYERLVGPITAGMEIDHTCKVPNCCNPAHLEMVTGEENRRRAEKRNHNSYASICKNGHALTEGNIYVWKGMRRCLACQREYMQERRRRKALEMGVEYGPRTRDAGGRWARKYPVGKAPQ